MSARAPVAIVTGGAQRIGRAIVEDLARSGWTVAIHYNRSAAAAEELAASIRASGGSAATIGADLADLGAVASIVARAEAALGKPVLLVNNASIFEDDQVGGLDAALWHRQMTINLTAPIFLAEAFAKALPEGSEGNIVNLVDQRAWKPTPRHFSYQISKSALWAATQVLAQALAPRVRVNAIAPGPALPNPRQTPERFQKQTESLLLGRGPELAEFGRTVRFLVENRSITGQMIGLDGGQHLAWNTPDVAAVEK
jgi:NAD(P)-dependent dehydrogenase (short-subunit alcohol dehydrogenase family)